MISRLDIRDTPLRWKDPGALPCALEEVGDQLGSVWEGESIMAAIIGGSPRDRLLVIMDSIGRAGDTPAWRYRRMVATIPSLPVRQTLSLGAYDCDCCFFI